MIKPNTAYVIPFETTAVGLPIAADATPTAVLWRNGSAEPTAVVIVTTANTGIYHATFTTDAGWATTDRLWLIVSATIDGDAYKGIVWDSFSESDSKAAIATAVAQYDQRTEEATPGSIGWLFKKVRQSNQAIEFVVTNDITPTTTTFSISLTTYDTSAFAHSVLLMLTGTAAEDNGVILSYTNNGTYATILLEKPMANAPSVGDEGLIRADSHVHSVAEIAAGVWGATSAAYSAATGTFGYLLHVINSAIGSLSSLIQGSTVLTVASPNVRGNLVLTQGDTYDGLPGSNPKAQWTVTTDYTDGWSVTLTIRDKDDAVVYTRAGSVDSATVVSVPINVPTVSPYEGCPGVWQGKYDVQLTKSSSIKTIAIGVVYINEDQTR